LLDEQQREQMRTRSFQFIQEVDDVVSEIMFTQSSSP
jgi:tagatose-1,6-bisphosphate aldolase